MLWTCPAHACNTLVIPDNIGQGAPASVTSLDPLLDGSSASQQAGLLLYRPLAWIGQDDRLDAARSLADSITADPAATIFRVTLKPWSWSDGRPVTAADVVFTWHLVQRLGPLFAFAGQGGVPDRVATVRALDAHTVEFGLRELTNPDWFILNGLSTFPALPQHAWGDPTATELWRHQNDPAFFHVVDGPFQIARFVPGRYAVFVPNPDYGGHRSQLSRLVVDFLPGANALHAAESGEVDMAHVPPELAGHVPAPAGYRIVPLPEAFGYRALIFNQARDAVFRDARVRQALAEAADQPAMVRLVYHGHAAQNRVPVPVSPPSWRAPGLSGGEYDPARAAALLDAAGWRVVDGARMKDGRQLQFTVLVSLGNEEALEELQILQQDLRAVGVAMQIRPVPESQLGATLFGGGAWDAAVVGFTRAGVPDGSGFFDTGGGYNAGGYSDPEMDRLIAASTRDPGRQALYAYEARAAAEQPWNFLPEGAFSLLVSRRIGGLEDFLSPEGYWSPEFLTCAP